MPATEILERLVEQHSLLSGRYDALMAACTTDAQRAQLRRAMLLAKENLAEARLRIFSENDAAIRELTTQLQGIEGRLRDSLNAFQEVTQVLHIVTAAVGLAQSLVALGQEDG